MVARTASRTADRWIMRTNGTTPGIARLAFIIPEAPPTPRSAAKLTVPGSFCAGRPTHPRAVSIDSITTNPARSFRTPRLTATYRKTPTGIPRHDPTTNSLSSRLSTCFHNDGISSSAIKRLRIIPTWIAALEFRTISSTGTEIIAKPNPVAVCRRAARNTTL